MVREYRTKPFNPVVSQKKAGRDEIAQQMGVLIAEGAAQGWMFQF